MENQKIELDLNDPTVRIQQQLYRNVMDIAAMEEVVTVEKKIKTDTGEKRLVFVIRAAAQDVGRVLGKKGHMIEGLRHLAYVTAFKLEIGLPVDVEVMEA